MKALARVPLLVTLAVIPSLAAAGSQPAGHPITPSELRRQIQARGARAVVWETFADDAARGTLLSGIRTGQRDWLLVAVDLYRASNAGASETLTSALRDALEANAENVLTLAPAEFPLAAVCGAPDVDTPRFPTLQAALSALSKRQARVKAIKTPGLLGVRDKCLTHLEAAKARCAATWTSSGKATGA